MFKWRMSGSAYLEARLGLQRLSTVDVRVRSPGTYIGDQFGDLYLKFAGVNNDWRLKMAVVDPSGKEAQHKSIIHSYNALVPSIGGYLQQRRSRDFTQDAIAELIHEKHGIPADRADISDVENGYWRNPRIIDAYTREVRLQNPQGLRDLMVNLEKIGTSIPDSI